MKCKDHFFKVVLTSGTLLYIWSEEEVRLINIGKELLPIKECKIFAVCDDEGGVQVPPRIIDMSNQNAGHTVNLIANSIKKRWRIKLSIRCANGYSRALSNRCQNSVPGSPLQLASCAPCGNGCA